MSEPDIVRATDRDRDAALERLRTATAEGSLSFEELNERIDAVQRSRTRAELARIVADLPTDLPVPATTASVVPATQPGRRTRIFTVYGDVVRAGRWHVEGRVAPATVFGDVELDLRQAVLAGDEIDIRAVAPFGNVELLVPDGTEVDVRGVTVFGHKKVTVRDSATGRPLVRLRVRAFTIFGNVKVWTP